jgi:hypothetical protein
MRHDLSLSNIGPARAGAIKLAANTAAIAKTIRIKTFPLARKPIDINLKMRARGDGLSRSPVSLEPVPAHGCGAFG